MANQVIEYYVKNQFGRIDYIPRDEKIKEVVRCFSKTNSIVITPKITTGLTLLGFLFKEVPAPQA